jgi:hypothetical protein
VNNGSENRLYKNNAGNSNKWVIFKLQGTASNRSAIGARVRVKTGSLSQIREVQGGSGGKGQNSLPLEFGLGSASTIDSVIISWPSGLTQRFANLNPDAIYPVVEGQEIGLNKHESGVPLNYALMQNYPNPFNPSTTINYQVKEKSFVTIRVFDNTGREINSLINNTLSPGYYSISFDGSKLTSGVYFYSFIIDGLVLDSKKMILIK